MEHYYHTIGQDWFTYPDLYRSMVYRFPDGANFVEVGSWKGRSACFMGVEIHNSGKRILMDCVDTFEGSDEHRDPANQNHDPVLSTRDGLYAEFLRNTRPLRHLITPIRLASVDAASLYDDQSLDFVFIDAAHDYDSVLTDIAAWRGKVKPGGVLAGHDYSWCHDVRRAVDDSIPFVVESEGCWVWYKSS
jgi:predicted O-methyltransferase YrrM